MRATEQKSWYSLLPPVTEQVNEKNLHEFFRTMFERQEIWYKRTLLKQKPPWTDDKILGNYRFTNVYRELDRASQWLIKNVLTDESLTVEDLIFRIITFRFYNQDVTFTGKYAVTLPHYKNFDADKLWEETVTYREKVGNPWSVAYFKNPRMEKPATWNKRGLFRDDVYCRMIIPAAHAQVPRIVKAINTKMPASIIMALLCQLPAVAGFTAFEFFLDFTYINKYWVKPWFHLTPDDYCNLGPGADLGVRMIFPSLPKKDRWQALEWLRDIAEDELTTFGSFKYIRWDRATKTYKLTGFNFDLHPIEMFLCEFSKYVKMQWGEGKQRSKFVPHHTAL